MAKEKHLILDTDCFYLQENRYAYSTVEALDFFYVQTQKRLNFTASGIDHNIDISIYIAGKEKPLKIFCGPQFFTIHGFNFGNDSSQNLIAKFNELSVQTFTQRANSYMDSLKSNGYFRYDGKKIYDSGEVHADNWSSHLVKEAPWLKRPFAIFREIREQSFFRSAIRHEIITVRDADVFFAVLNKLYGLKWN